MLLQQSLRTMARAILFLTVSCAYAEQYTVTDLGLLTGNAVNRDGQITGESSAPDHAFIYSDGHFSDLGTLGGARSAGLSINDIGQVTGFSQLFNPIPTNGLFHAFLYGS